MADIKKVQNPNHSENKKTTLEKFSYPRAHVNNSQKPNGPKSKVDKIIQRLPRDHGIFQEVYLSFQCLRNICKETFLWLLGHGLNCSRTIWEPQKKMEEELGLTNSKVKYRLGLLVQFGFIERIWRREGYTTYTRYIMKCVCVDLPRIILNAECVKLSPMNYFDLKKKNSKRVDSVRLHKTTDIGHGFTTIRDRPPPMRYQPPQTKVAAQWQIRKLLEEYGFVSADFTKQVRDNLFHSTYILKMTIEQWRHVFTYVKNNPFLNGNTGASKWYLSWMSAVDNVRKVLANKFKQYPARPHAEKKAVSDNPTKKLSTSKIMSVVDCSMVGGKHNYVYLRKEFTKMGILEQVEKAVINLENLYNMSWKSLDIHLRTI